MCTPRPTVTPITVQFFAGVPVQTFNWISQHRPNNSSISLRSGSVLLQVQKQEVCRIHVDQSHLSWSEECQLAILHDTVLHDQTTKHPPSRNYTKFFLKYLINKVESLEETCSEALCNLYVNLLHEENKSSCFKSYYMPSLNEFAVIKESTSLLSAGTTGLVTWKGGLFLAEWCLNNQALLNGRNILELGSGCGLTGIVLSKCLDLKSYTFTDVHAQVLEQLKENVQLNRLDKGKYSSVCLDWNEGRNGLQADVILGADVVFDPDLIPPLVKTLCNVLHNQAATVAYLASTVRNQETYGCFLAELRAANLNFQTMPTDGVQRIFYYEIDTDIEIVKISVER